MNLIFIKTFYRELFWHHRMVVSTISMIKKASKSPSCPSKNSSLPPKVKVVLCT